MFTAFLLTRFHDNRERRWQKSSQLRASAALVTWNPNLRHVVDDVIESLATLRIERVFLRPL